MIAHDEIWPVRPESALTGAPSDALIFLSFPSIQEPLALLKEYAVRIRDSLVQEFGERELIQVFAGRKAQPACLMYLPSASSVMRNGLPTLVRLNVLNLMPVAELDSRAMDVTAALHHRMQLSHA
jgi:hypothetical protein